ncbi:MAG: four helix bundle protein [Patescibacteria group bacterium]
MEKIRNFTDLIAWQEAHKLVLLTYKITNNFPQKEIYALTSQMRRAVISVTSNIAEGFSRKSSKEKIQFFYMALGSSTELQNQFIISKDIKYINNQNFNEVFNLINNVQKLTYGLIKNLKNSLNTN